MIDRYKKGGLMKKVIFFVLMMTVSVMVFAEEEKSSTWKKDISLGYNRTTGNTQASEFSFSGTVKNVMENSEFSARADVYYASTNKKMDSQKWSAALRYFFNYGDANQWFNSYQLLVDHDRFSDIDYRMTPSVGVGYWFSNTDDCKKMLEASIGYEATNYRSNKADDKDAVFIARGYLEKKIFETSTISEDVSVIPSLEGNGTRIKSETVFTNPLKENLDLNVKFIVEHDTKPSAGIKKTDTRFVTGIKYSF